MISKDILDAINGAGVPSVNFKFAPSDRISLRGDIIFDMSDNKKVLFFENDENEQRDENLKRLLKYVTAEFCTFNDETVNGSWDYLIIGEALEQVSNPVSFLQSVVNKYKNNVSNMIITVSNVFSGVNLDNTNTKNGENVNTKRKYWFSPYTLCNIANEAGLKLKNIYTAGYEGEWGNIVDAYEFYCQKPLLLDMLVLEAAFQ